MFSFVPASWPLTIALSTPYPTTVRTTPGICYKLDSRQAHRHRTNKLASSFTIDAILGRSDLDENTSFEEDDPEAGAASRSANLQFSACDGVDLPSQHRYSAAVFTSEISAGHTTYLAPLSVREDLAAWRSRSSIFGKSRDNDKGKEGDFDSRIAFRSSEEVSGWSLSEAHATTDHDSYKPKRARTIFTQVQLQRLEREFTRQQYMVGQERLYLAAQLHLTESQVKVWFQNRRIKWRKHDLDKQQAQLAQYRNTLRERAEQIANKGDDGEGAAGVLDEDVGNEKHSK